MYDSPNSSVYFDEAIAAVICVWKTNCDAKCYQTTMLEGINILLETQSKTWVVDFYEEIDKIPEDEEWFANTFLPMTVNDSIENIFFIIRPNCKIKKEITDKRVNHYKNLFNVEIFENMEELHTYFLKKKEQ
jgi:hypothetical protein